MAIIAEAFSVFIRRQTVYANLRTEVDYYKTIQNPSIGADPDLYRAGFLTMKDVEEHLEALRGLGFQVEVDKRSKLPLWPLRGDLRSRRGRSPRRPAAEKVISTGSSSEWWMRIMSTSGPY